MMRRVGIYAGTFAPVHKGHIAFCLAALEACELDEIIFIPEITPRYKQGVMPLERRLARLETALASYSKLKVVLLKEAQLSVKETLPQLHTLAGDAELVLLMGSDVFCGLPYWQDVAELIPQVSFAVGLRRADTQEMIKKVVQQLEQQTGIPVNITIAEVPFRFMASSHVRRLGSAACRGVVDFSA